MYLKTNATKQTRDNGGVKEIIQTISMNQETWIDIFIRLWNV